MGARLSALAPGTSSWSEQAAKLLPARMLPAGKRHRIRGPTKLLPTQALPLILSAYELFIALGTKKQVHQSTVNKYLLRI